MNFNILTNDIEYTPWSIITKLTPAQELDEIKNILGPKLISEIEVNIKLNNIAYFNIGMLMNNGFIY